VEKPHPSLGYPRAPSNREEQIRSLLRTLARFTNYPGRAKSIGQPLPATQGTSPKRTAVLQRIESSVKEEYSFLLDALYEVWQGKWKQGVRKYQEVTVREIGEDFRIVLYFSGTEWLFVQTYKNTRWVSRTYSSRDVAMFALGNKIEWLYEEQIS
jgi:hypothetical protein